MRTDNYIELASGAHYSPGRDHDWDIKDVAHALGNQCRYTGHCRHFYSVAEHSVLCSLLAEELELCDPFEALMHDGHESVISDMAAPWKPHLKDFRALERQVEANFRAHFDLPNPVTDGCKRVDWLALFLEAHYLMPSRGEGWVDPLNVRVEALRLALHRGWRVQGLDPQKARSAFLERYRALRSMK